MKTVSNNLSIIGRAEKVDFVELGIFGLPAKVDTGADKSAVWAHEIKEENGKLKVVFLGPNNPHYTGQAVIFEPGDFAMTRIANSFGHREMRYMVKIKTTVNGKTIRGTFSLSDRSKKLYPVLIGRSLLAGKFLVDVTKGDPLIEEEKKRKRILKKMLADNEGDI